jgi:VanZ family protein
MLIKNSSAAGDPRAANWSLLCAGVLVMQIFALGSLPFELLEPGNTLVHCLAFSALTLLLWIATDGRRPRLVVAGVMGLAMLDELRQAALPMRSADVSDFLVNALAAGATGALLFWFTTGVKKQCAES